MARDLIEWRNELMDVLLKHGCPIADGASIVDTVDKWLTEKDGLERRRTLTFQQGGSVFNDDGSVLDDVKKNPFYKDEQ